MALKTTIKKLHNMLAELTHDLTKAEKGNKAASQRVRTGSIQFAKVAKEYRKESVKNEKAAPTKKKKAKKAVKKAVSKKAPVRKQTVKRKATRRARR